MCSALSTILNRVRKVATLTFVMSLLLGQKLQTILSPSFNTLLSHIDSWVRNITFCLDNARVCKNKYMLAWANELVDQGRFESVRFFYLEVGHTKFEPDRLFASIAKTFYKRDVFCIEMLQAIAELYSTSYVCSGQVKSCSGGLF